MPSLQIQVVTLVLQQQPSVAALKHIGPLITSFLGPDPNRSLCEACKFGSTELLDWVWDASADSVVVRTSTWTLCNYLRSEPLYREWQFRKSLEVAAGREDAKVVNWWLDHFSGLEIPSEVVTAAAKKGHFPVLKLLLDRDAGRGGGGNHAVKDVVLVEDEWADSVPVMPAG
ncbi:La-related protein 6 [Phytophthora cinnamomi]|uniref:La-related protein 6 n=1 Tax=Phytophthora cinnamomi TaxID=4785 RepID=UPI00355A3000|nr:La-related protein 6 [Phytophthora cinnamomi]